jgi:two-component sensor histidine kinase
LNSSYILEIKDNGIGLKNDFNLEKMDSLGLNLINSIATIQLNGKLKIINSNGTHLSISFRL